MLDVKDLKILKELDANPKILTTTLAKKIRLSQQVVDYRIKRLMEKGVISGFGTVFNFAKINYSQYRILLTFSSVDQNKRKEVIDYLRSHKNVYWVALVGSKWDLFVVLFVKNFDDFENFLDVLFNKFSNSLSDYDALYVPYHEFYGHKFLDEKNIGVIRINFSEKGSVVLDELDSKILKQVRNNCRFSNLEIGNNCGVSYKTVQNRIKNLENNGFICGYRLFLKSEMLGCAAYLLLFAFTSYGRDIEKKLLSYVRNHKLITQVSKTFGAWSLMFHARTKNVKELQDLLIELRNLYPTLGQPEIIPVFEDITINNLPID